MNPNKVITCFILVVLLATACNNQQQEPAKQPVVIENEKKESGTFCFLHALNRDTTKVTLTIDSNKVTGQMQWIPYEKDGAVGTLLGTKNKNGELELIYDYIIEGNKQTETKVMKIENGKLMIKSGELLDPNNDGNLKYKDVTKATYTEILDSVSCK